MQSIVENDLGTPARAGNSVTLTLDTQERLLKQADVIDGR
jgi:hypothetical protein